MLLSVCCYLYFFYSNILVSVYLSILDISLASHFDTQDHRKLWIVWYIYIYCDYKYNLDLFLFLFLCSHIIFLKFLSPSPYLSFSFTFSPPVLLFFMGSICFTNVLVLFLYNLLLLIHIFHASIPLYQYIITFLVLTPIFIVGECTVCCIHLSCFHLWCHFPLFCDIRLVFLGKMRITWNKDWNWDLHENLSVLPETPRDHWDQFQLWSWRFSDFRSRTLRAHQ